MDAIRGSVTNAGPNPQSEPAEPLRYRDAMEELHLNRLIFQSVTSGISPSRTSTRPSKP
jgi:hypothetical protein